MAMVVPEVPDTQRTLLVAAVARVQVERVEIGQIPHIMSMGD